LFEQSNQGNQGCHIFIGTTYQNGKNIPNNHKIYQIATKIPITNGHKIYQYLPLHDLSKFTKIGDCVLKICHLATMMIIHIITRASICPLVERSVKL
jgi:hypothetical protein